MKYQIIDQQYVNTGGNCMVQVCEVYLYDENKTIWAITDGETVSLITANYIMHEINDENLDWERMTIVSHQCADLQQVYWAGSQIRICLDCMKLFKKNNQ